MSGLMRDDYGGRHSPEFCLALAAFTGVCRVLQRLMIECNSTVVQAFHFRATFA